MKNIENFQEVKQIKKYPICNFRYATLDDVERIMQINDQIEHRWTVDKFHEVFENNIPIILAYDENNVMVGYIVYFLVLDEGRIINITIDPHYQKRSYGRQLMHRSLECMHDSDIHYAILDVKTDNYPAIDLYTKMGFQILCRRIGYYVGDVEGDSYFMQLKLS